MFVSRNITTPLLQALGDTPVVLLGGARQTGKSTLVRHLAATDHPSRYLSFDDIAVLGAAKQDPHGFLDGLTDPCLILDEVQKVPELLPAIKNEVDRRRRPGRFLLTGSANVLTLPRISESLAGRMEVLTLWPLAQNELHGHPTRFLEAAFDPRETPPAVPENPMWPLVARGGYPEIIDRARARREAWFRSYLTTVLHREIRDLADIEGLTELPRLLALLAARSGGLSNFAELSRASGIPQTTLKRYLALLEAAFLIVRIPAWSGSASRRLTRSPKWYLNDAGLLAHLLGFDAERIQGQTQSGRIFENFVLMEIVKLASAAPDPPRILHFRTVRGREVDFVLEARDGRTVAVEAKAGATLGPNDLKGMREMEEILGDRFVRGVILYTGTEVIPFSARVQAWPVSVLWDWNDPGA